MEEKKEVGFARLTPEERAAAASVGGKAAAAKGTAHKFTSETGSKAGKIGGAALSKDRTHMAEIGQKGGSNLVTSLGIEHMSDIGKLGGAALLQQKGSKHFASISKKGLQVRLENMAHRDGLLDPDERRKVQAARKKAAAKRKAKAEAKRNAAN